MERKYTIAITEIGLLFSIITFIICHTYQSEQKLHSHRKWLAATWQPEPEANDKQRLQATTGENWTWAGLEIFFFNFKASNWSDYQWEHRIPVIDIWEVGKYITGLPRHAGQHRKWFVATCWTETIESEWNLVFSSNNRQRKHWWHEKESFLYKILTCGSPFKLCLHREWIAYCALLPCDMTVTSILDSLVVWS